MVREHDALTGDAVDVRRPVAHGAEAIGADVLPTDIIWKNDENVGLLVRSVGRRECEGAAEYGEYDLRFHGVLLKTEVS
jgi:hypothetical protein